MLSNRNYLHQIRAPHTPLEISADDVFLSVLPVWHSYERAIEYVAIFGGCSIAYSKLVSQVLIEDMAKVQSFLENKVVVQKLVDYGVSPAEAMAKVKAMSAQDLHRLASLTDRAAAGTDSAIGFLIALAILIILIIVILKLMNKEVVVR